MNSNWFRFIDATGIVKLFDNPTVFKGIGKDGKLHIFIKAYVSVYDAKKGIWTIHDFPIDLGLWDDIFVYNGWSRYHKISLPVKIRIMTPNHPNYEKCICHKDDPARSYEKGVVVEADGINAEAAEVKGKAKVKPFEPSSKLPVQEFGKKATTTVVTPCV